MILYHGSPIRTKTTKLYIMKKMTKALLVILNTIIGIMICGMLFTFLLMLVNEDELAFNAMSIAVYSILPLFFVAIVLDTKIRRA